MRAEEEKIYDISNKYRKYDGEDNNLQRNIRENYRSWAELLNPRTEGKTYKSLIKQLQFIMNNDKSLNKNIQEMMKESETKNNTNTHA